MDVENLAKELILKNMTPEQQMAVLDSIKESVAKAKEVQKRKIGENVDLVVQALKKIEEDIRSRYDDIGNAIEKRVASIKDGRDGIDGRDGKDGKDGKPGKEGRPGREGKDGKDGLNGTDGQDGVSVVNAHIDFDGSLVIHLSSGKEINVGEVVAQDLAEKIKVITNGGGTSQVVLDTLASLQTQIDDLIPSQSGQSGKFLTTNGSVLSWSSGAGGLSYQGTWNASTNTPTLASGVGTNGYYYIVSTAGSTNLDGITDWQIGDWLMFNGTIWQKIDQSNLVTSVNGQTGAVSLTTTNINEGTNLYYLDSRARQSLSAGTGISYSTSTGVITNSSPDQTVSLTGAGTTSISGTYPSFTITSNDQYQGTVTSVAQTFTGGLISVSGSPITSSGTLALTVAGTSGGIPYFSSASTWASSGALTANALVIGGGAGVAPSTTTTGTGVVTALGVNVGTAGSFVVNGGALGTPSSGTVTNLTGTASININGTVGATTPTTGAFTTLSATGVATFSAGSAAAPAITTSGDTNTGIFFPTADAVGFAAGGADVARITAGQLSVSSTSSSGSSLRLYEDTDNGTNYVDIVAPAAITSDRTLTLPDLTGTVSLATYTTQVFTSSGTYTKPAGVSAIKVTVVGGGGGGGSAAANAPGFNSAATGGGGAGTSIKLIAASSVGSTETITIGALGSGGTSGGNGTAGGTSSFGSHCSATGGGAGLGCPTISNAGQNTEGGATSTGGVGSGGTINLTGGSGGFGFSFASPNRGVGGSGGSSFLCGGPEGQQSTAISAAATQYGAGGSGGASLGNSPAVSGGNGAAGIIIVEEFY